MLIFTLLRNSVQLCVIILMVDLVYPLTNGRVSVFFQSIKKGPEPLIALPRSSITELYKTIYTIQQNVSRLLQRWFPV